MAHLNFKANLLGLPGAKYWNLNVDGSEKPYVCIPADAQMFQIEMEQRGTRNVVKKVIANIRLWHRQRNSDTAPSHEAQLSLSEELRKQTLDSMESQMNAYLANLTDEKFTEFCINTFQNKQGTANMPKDRAEAAHWYTMRNALVLGPAWEDKPQAPKAEGQSIAVAAPPVAPEFNQPEEDLPF